MPAASRIHALLLAPLVVSAARYCSLKPPNAVLSSSGPSSGGASGSAGTQPGLNSSSHGGTDPTDVVATAWYPGWNNFPPSEISWSKYNAMTFAFATTTPDSSTIALDDQSAALLPTFVATAQANGVSALLSIGGWTGSMYYSSAVASAANRTSFAAAVLGLVSTYQLDGIDFECVPLLSAPGDSANFLVFLQELRSTPAGQNLILTAAVGLKPFAGPDGNPMDDVSGFAKVLDRIAIMDYDVFGPGYSQTVGPNAPLNDTCAPPAQQITLGLASYGHSWPVTPSEALDGAHRLQPYASYSKSAPSGGSGNSGDSSFAALIDTGFLDSNGTAASASGISFVFDQCSQTPFVYNSTSQVMVSYDDAQLFIAAKGQFINSMGLAGFAVWDVTGDKNDLLLDSLHQSMGIESVCD
ncbi:unnamed protein product [Mycena citricolor]|uniref:GH18 domain-containing protein n=1 Tax=Mycena citricolor TaxID=2018698 RepID=A0AAD2Q4E0_9AGAR|nr:unnamed protein product [Mycena citricolor]